MALTEKTKQELFISDNGMIRVKDFIIVEKDGVEISQSRPHSKVIDVDDDVTNESDRIKAIAPGIWTAQVKAARISEKARNQQ